MTEATSRIQEHLEALCVDLPHRHVGSEENRRATRYFHDLAQAWGYPVERQQLGVLDWSFEDCWVEVKASRLPIHAGPYSFPFEGSPVLVTAGSMEELRSKEVTGKLLLLHGDLTAEQISPKSFPFYNPEHHQALVQHLEQQQPAAILAATGKHPESAGSVYPFPLFEDGDFDLPNGYMKDVDGAKLLVFEGVRVPIHIVSRRIPVSAENLVLRKGDPEGGKLLITAHIDSKPGTPGALDNAAGVAVLLVLSELLREYDGIPALEIVPFNGEDYYAIPGQMRYLADYPDGFDALRMVINMDAVGYKHGRTAWSLYNGSEVLRKMAQHAFGGGNSFMEGPQWVQGDHSMFTMAGVPALALTSERFQWLCSEITHTLEDHVGQIDASKLAELALTLSGFIRSLAART